VAGCVLLFLMGLIELVLHVKANRKQNPVEYVRLLLVGGLYKGE
jgi:hypothetical protein